MLEDLGLSNGPLQLEERRPFVLCPAGKRSGYFRLLLPAQGLPKVFLRDDRLLKTNRCFTLSCNQSFDVNVLSQAIPGSLSCHEGDLGPGQSLKALCEDFGPEIARTCDGRAFWKVMIRDECTREADRLRQRLLTRPVYSGRNDRNATLRRLKFAAGAFALQRGDDWRNKQNLCWVRSVRPRAENNGRDVVPPSASAARAAVDYGDSPCPERREQIMPPTSHLFGRKSILPKPACALPAYRSWRLSRRCWSSLC
jgi:hypothetical protein